MPIVYSPPKSLIWGHRVNRLSPLQLLERSRRFFQDQTQVVDLHAKICLNVLWKSAHSEAVDNTIQMSRRLVGDEGEDLEFPHDGEVWRRITRNLASTSLRAAVDWMEILDPMIDDSDQVLFVTLSQHVWFRWRQPSRPGDAVAPIPDSLFGVDFGRPRHVSTAIHFESVQHYQDIKRYLDAIGLVRLSDRHVRPKGAIDAIAP